MSIRLAALAACVAALSLAWPAQAASPAAPLTLDDAFVRVAQTHPELRLFGPRHEALLAELDRAALTPALVTSLDVETVLGTGLCGALTTYSTFSYESLRLLEDGARFYATLYVCGSLVAGFGAVGLGWTLGAGVAG